MIPNSIVKAVQICALQGVRNAVLSPGSRCAPITLAFVRHPEIETRTVSDERSAAFIALGMAQQLQQPVVLVCTSGSAAYNYAPAIAEAYFQQIPLIILTADRPAEWIDQLDGQTIRQRNIYGSHIKGNYELPTEDHVDIQWHADRIVSEAINLSQNYPAGPVHINVPIREPFYPKQNDILDFNQPVKVINNKSGEINLTEAHVDVLAKKWELFPKKLIVCGQHAANKELTSVLFDLSEKHKIPVVADIVTNQHHLSNVIKHPDTILAQKDEKVLNDLQPDLIITFGLSVISKNLKLFLRKFQPKEHWHIQSAGQVADTYQSLTQILQASPISTLKIFHTFAIANEIAYYNFWQAEEQKAYGLMNNLFSKNISFEDSLTSKSGEFEAVKIIMEALPHEVDLHLANSMAVRYANLIGINRTSGDVRVYANRGTSGIDGSNSTAVGSAIISNKITVLITGDMAFFYDRNAFWHNYKLPNLRIIVLNNHGGGIFRMIDGPSRQPELEEYFETMQPLNAKNTALDFGLDYSVFDLNETSQMEDLKTSLPVFFENKGTHGKILEIISDGKINQKIFNQYKSIIKESYGA